MPLNKEALIRYRVINRLLVDKRIVTKKEIIRACESALEISPIGERTIAQDIRDMKEDDRLGYDAPIKFDRIRGGYYYANTNYSIDNIPVKSEELKALSFAANMLYQYKDVSLFNTFAGAVQKISDVINIRKSQHQHQNFDFIEFEKAPSIKGSEFLNPIVEAIQGKKVIDFEYERFQTQTKVAHSLHPYLLKEYRNRWYVIGWHQKYNEIRTFGLDRITKLDINTKTAFITKEFDSKEYFRNTVGMIAPETEAEEIILRFIYSQGQYVLTQPIHESQVIVEEKPDFITISLKVSITYELISLILGWGSDVEIIKPVALRKQIKGQLEGTLKNYK